MKQVLSIIAIFFALFVHTSIATESNLRGARALKGKATKAPEQQAPKKAKKKAAPKKKTATKKKTAPKKKTTTKKTKKDEQPEE